MYNTTIVTLQGTVPKTSLLQPTPNEEAKRIFTVMHLQEINQNLIGLAESTDTGYPTNTITC